MSLKKAPFVLALATLSLALAVTADLVFAGQDPAVRSTTLKKAKSLQMTNYVLRLPDAYIVYEPSKDVFQIAALGAVLSYGDGWERVQVKPYLFHIGIIRPWPAKSVEVDGERENFDQKANQLFNILSTVMKNMKETQQGITRNLL